MTDFILRIFLTDYYLTKPVPKVDFCYNEFNCQEILIVPIIRIYGTTPSGQKVCSHIHGVFPYFYVEFPDDILMSFNDKEEIDKYLIQFANRLNQSIKSTMENKSTFYSSNNLFVYRIVIVRGKQFYGYQNNFQYFLKIYLFNPTLIKVAADLLLNGTVNNRPMQPYESHIPYNLQFFIDYNLYGMNYLFTDGAKFRLDKDHEICGNFSGYSNESQMFVNVSQRVWHPSQLALEDQLTDPIALHKETSCELEIDIAACDILNILEVANNIGQNPGLKNLWEEEKNRRAALGINIALEGEPFEERPLAKPSKSETRLLDRWNQIVGTIAEEQFEENQSYTDEINRFINQSQSDDDLMIVEESSTFNLTPTTVSQSPLDANNKEVQNFINSCIKLEEDDSIVLSDSDDVPTDHFVPKGSSFSQVASSKHQPTHESIEVDSDSDTDLFSKTFIDLSLDSNSDDEQPEAVKKTSVDNQKNPESFNASCEDLFEDAESISDSDSKDESISLLETYDGADDNCIPNSKTDNCTESSFSCSSKITASQRKRIIEDHNLTLIPLITKKLKMERKNKKKKVRLSLQLKSKPAQPNVLETTCSNCSSTTEPSISSCEHKSLIITQVLKTPTKISSSDIQSSLSVITALTPVKEELLLSPVASSKPQISTPARRKTASLTQQFIDISPISKHSQKSKISIQKNVSFNIPDVSQDSPFASPLKLSTENVNISERLHTFEFMKKSVSEFVHDVSSCTSFLNQNNSQTCHLTLLSCELFSSSTLNLKSNPKSDSILMFFYAVYNENDVPDDIAFESQPILAGIIYVDNGNDTMRSAGIIESDKQKLHPVSNETELLDKIIDLVWEFDPDILVGFETVRSSWGYLLERAFYLKHKLFYGLSRLNNGTYTRDPWKEFKMSELHCNGRIILDLWVILRYEISLNSYTVENCVNDVLKERVPHYTNQQLLVWFRSNLDRHLVINYWNYRVLANIRLLMKLNIISRTSEFAKIFGIEFYHVLSRGSQYRVESMMLRLAKPQNLIAISPSVNQRARQKAPECIPLTLEPKSGLYRDPVVVLDFQSLYPSVMIGYNYCYASTLGKLDHLSSVERKDPYELGCAKMFLNKETIQNVGSNVTVSPNGVVFVRPEFQKGIISKMVEEILNTRIMIKKSMKIHSENKTLCKILDSRQLGLKLIANVTFGYTAACFSGRMPCVEVGDSIVRKSRETLEEAIKLVNSGGPEGVPKSDTDGGWAGCSVIYGDTDSLFILMPNRSKSDAFNLGARIADSVSARNPFPVKLKFEKVYLPCLLEAKKRYVGYSYESPNQTEPKFDAKGIETVRRDNCGIVSKILERSLIRLFSSSNIDNVKRYVTQQLDKIVRGDVNLIDFIIAKEYRGRQSYKAGSSIPALRIANELIKADPRAEPLRHERVAYIVIQGAPGDTLISCVRRPEDVLFNTRIMKAYGNNIRQLNEQGCRLSYTYYITKQILPPLSRALSLINVDVFNWYSQLPKRPKNTYHNFDSKTSKNLLNKTISSYFRCRSCLLCNSVVKPQSNLSDNNIKVVLCEGCLKKGKEHICYSALTQMKDIEECRMSILEKCFSCSNTGPSVRGIGPPCVSQDCPLFFSRIRAFQQPNNHLEKLLNSSDL